jgi:hypothetical protein
MSSYQQFLDANRSKLLGYFLMMAVNKDSSVLKTPYVSGARKLGHYGAPLLTHKIV